MSIVRQVTESHGGTVRAESAPGGGILIRFRLPGGRAQLRISCTSVAAIPAVT